MKINYKCIITGAATVAVASSALADSVLVDRGLPTANLNNSAGSDRSNVAWADGESSASPSEYYVPGDSFTMGGTGTYTIDKIRVWETGTSTTGLSLLGGLAGDSIGTLSSTVTGTSVTYANGETYQSQSGDFIPLTELDFTVNLTMTAGQTLDFFLNGPFTGSGSSFTGPYLHASNAALSGSQQDGSDDTFLYLHVNGGTETVETWQSGTGAGTTGFGSGWDKNSDANVQVFGSAVPDSCSTMVLMSGALGALGLIRRKK